MARKKTGRPVGRPKKAPVVSAPRPRGRPKKTSVPKPPPRPRGRPRHTTVPKPPRGRGRPAKAPNLGVYPKNVQGGMGGAGRGRRGARRIGTGAFAEFTDTDMGWEAAVAEADMLDGAYVEVGYFRDEASHNRKGRRRVRGKVVKNLSVLQRAALNQFGSPKQGIPARPWLTAGFDAWYKTTGRSEFDRLFAGRPSPGQMVTALREAGVVMQMGMFKQGQAWSTPGNAPATERNKGFDDPLVESSEMIAAPVIRYKMRGGGVRKGKLARWAEKLAEKAEPKAARVRVRKRRAGRTYSGGGARFGFGPGFGGTLSRLKTSAAEAKAMRAPGKSGSKKATNTRFVARPRFRPGGTGKRPPRR